MLFDLMKIIFFLNKISPHRVTTTGQGLEPHTIIVNSFYRF